MDVEKVARSLCRSEARNWEDFAEWYRENKRAEARAAIRAVLEQEPTEEIDWLSVYAAAVNVGHQCDYGDDCQEPSDKCCDVACYRETQAAGRAAIRAAHAQALKEME